MQPKFTVVLIPQIHLLCDPYVLSLIFIFWPVKYSTKQELTQFQYWSLMTLCM